MMGGWTEEGYLKRWVWIKRVNDQWVFCDNVYRVFSISFDFEQRNAVSSSSKELTERDFLLRELKCPIRPIASVLHDFGYGVT